MKLTHIRQALEVVIICVVMGLILYGIGMVVIGASKGHEARVKTCESKGGIFYEGGLGADNCVFPPKESQNETD